MKKIILLLCVSVLVSCSKTAPEPFDKGFKYTDVNITLQNSLGDDLLGTASYDPSTIKIYYRINGQTVEVYNPAMGAPRNFTISTQTTPKKMALHTNDAITELEPITYIQWNATDTDTIVTRFSVDEHYRVRTNMLWYNGDLVWDGVASSTLNDREITIVK
jgi:hypothetical protein